MLILRKLLTWLSAMLPSDHLIQLWGRTCSSWWQTPGCSPSTQLQPALLGLVRGLELLLHLLDLFIDQFSTQGEFFLLSSIFLFMEVTLALVVDVKPSFSLKAFALPTALTLWEHKSHGTLQGPWLAKDHWWNHTCWWTILLHVLSSYGKHIDEELVHIWQTRFLVVDSFRYLAA